MKKSIRPKDAAHWIRVGCTSEKHWEDTVRQLSILHESGVISQKTFLECLGLDRDPFNEERY